MLDLRHAQLLGARVECRPRPRPRDRLHDFGTVEVARPAQVLLAPCTRILPAAACDSREPLHEARRDRRRAGKLAGAREKDLRHTEKLREVVRGEPDASLGQVETQFKSHRPR